MTTKTTKPVFKKFHRFDTAKAAKGVAHHIVDEWGNEYPIWTTSLFDVGNKFLKVAQEKFARENADDPQSKGKFSTLYAFVQVCVHGWENMLDENDKPIPFDKELAFDYLIDEDNVWFMNEIIERAKDVHNYPVTAAATKEADAGN